MVNAAELAPNPVFGKTIQIKPCESDEILRGPKCTVFEFFLWNIAIQYLHVLFHEEYFSSKFGKLVSEDSLPNKNCSVIYFHTPSPKEYIIKGLLSCFFLFHANFASFSVGFLTTTKIWLELPFPSTFKILIFRPLVIIIIHGLLRIKTRSQRLNCSQFYNKIHAYMYI